MTRDEARQVALRYLYEKVMNGATRDSLSLIIHEGFSGPGEHGYEISRNRITVPGCICNGPRHSFDIPALIKEIKAVKKDLWGRGS